MKTCSKCHKVKEDSEFYHWRAQCKDCWKIRHAEWETSKKGQQSHKSAIKRYQQSEKGKIKRKQWVKSEVGVLARKKYRQSKTYKLAVQRYWTSARGKAAKARAGAIRRSRIKQTTNDLTLEQWNEILLLQENACNVCYITFEGTTPNRDHIIPLSKGGGLTKNNVQALCKPCNSRKGIN